MRINNENNLMWESFKAGQVQEEGLFARNKKKRDAQGGRRDEWQSAEDRRDKQWEKGRKQAADAEALGVDPGWTEMMDDYGYMDDDYAEPLASVRHPDNIERESNPAHNYIRHQPESDKYTEEDRVLDHNGKTIKRKDINGGRDRVVRDSARHDGRGRTDDNAVEGTREAMRAQRDGERIG